ncbi:MAG: hypothetical protein IH840_07635 [Candidatus Heimdallarchaeota archaeon]|nr:hypothetical protein [Candidatus Heimdallarchaeota archaeon]
MSSVNATNLHQLVKILKDIKVKLTPELPNYANYGLFYSNHEISTGLINDSIEMKINLEVGKFHYYDAKLVTGGPFDLTISDFDRDFRQFLSEMDLELSFDRLNPITLEEMKRFSSFAFEAKRVLEQFRLTLEGKYSQVYLWGHNFDFDCVWYGDDGKQIDVGVSPGDLNHPDPYLYITHHPFNRQLIRDELPFGSWITEPWKGILVPWASLTDKPDQEIVLIIQGLFNEIKLGLEKY